MNDDTDGYVSADAAGEAFKLLGNGTRVAVLRALFETDESGHVTPTERTFTELYEASGESSTAGFAYHLRQLVGHYLRKSEGEGDDSDTYALTYAGLQVARAVAAGTYTRSVDRDPVSLPEPCPFCHAQDGDGLELRVRDNLTTVSCVACERDVLSLPFPPGGFRSHDEASLPRAFDTHHRHRISLMADGNCPECAGAVDHVVERIDAPTDGETEDSEGDTPPLAQLSLDCRTCGYSLRCPVTVALLDHPAVVAFAHDHDVSLEERPIWNVGPAWAEQVVSTDPLVIRVTLTLDEETLSLFVGRDLTVGHEERVRHEATEADERERETVASETETELEPSDADSAAV